MHIKKKIKKKSEQSIELPRVQITRQIFIFNSTTSNPDAPIPYRYDGETGSTKKILPRFGQSFERGANKEVRGSGGNQRVCLSSYIYHLPFTLTVCLCHWLPELVISLARSVSFSLVGDCWTCQKPNADCGLSVGVQVLSNQWGRLDEAIVIIASLDLFVGTFLRLNVLARHLVLTPNYQRLDVAIIVTICVRSSEAWVQQWHWQPRFVLLLSLCRCVGNIIKISSFEEDYRADRPMVQRASSSDAPSIQGGHNRESRFGLGYTSYQSGYNKLFTQVQNLYSL